MKANYPCRNAGDKLSLLIVLIRRTPRELYDYAMVSFGLEVRRWETHNLAELEVAFTAWSLKLSV